MGAGGDRGTVLVLRGPETMCVLVNLESAVCVPAPVASCPFKPQRRGCLLELVIYLGPVGGCCSRKSHVCGSVCYQPCVFLFTSGICAQHYYWLNLLRGKWQPHSLAWAETPGPWMLGSSSQAGGSWTGAVESISNSYCIFMKCK